jgi:hypothetical protein
LLFPYYIHVLWSGLINNCALKLSFNRDILPREVYSHFSRNQISLYLLRKQIHPPWSYNTLSPTLEVVYVLGQDKNFANTLKIIKQFLHCFMPSKCIKTLKDSTLSHLYHSVDQYIRMLFSWKEGLKVQGKDNKRVRGMLRKV